MLLHKIYINRIGLLIMKGKVVVKRCDSYSLSEVEKEIINVLGLLDFRFKKGIRVLIKPNILGVHKPEQAITTHPVLVEGVCKILEKKNAKIYIGESSASESDKAFEISGIAKIARKYGKIIYFEKEKKIKVNAGKFGDLYLPSIIRDVDLIINMPKLKTHSLTKMTGAVKNLFGFISGGMKSSYHRIYTSDEKMSELFVEIYNHIKPGLNIMDGIIGLEGNGPGTGGLPRETGIILVSKNAVAMDIVASEIIGYKAMEIQTNKIAREQELVDSVEIIGDAKDVRIDYKKPISTGKGIGIAYFISSIIPDSKIGFNHDKCTKCGKCRDNCPTKAIIMKPFPECTHKKCIKCFCCIEVCPENAVYLKMPLIRRIAERGYRMISGS